MAKQAQTPATSKARSTGGSKTSAVAKLKTKSTSPTALALTAKRKNAKASLMDRRKLRNKAKDEEAKDVMDNSENMAALYMTLGVGSNSASNVSNSPTIEAPMAVEESTVTLEQALEAFSAASL